MAEKKERLWSAPFVNMLAVQFCLQMGQQMMNTLVPKYANALGAAASVVGMVSSVFSITSTLILILSRRPLTAAAANGFCSAALPGWQRRLWAMAAQDPCRRCLCSGFFRGWPWDAPRR